MDWIVPFLPKGLLLLLRIGAIVVLRVPTALHPLLLVVAPNDLRILLLVVVLLLPLHVRVPVLLVTLRTDIIMMIKIVNMALDFMMMEMMP